MNLLAGLVFLKILYFPNSGAQKLQDDFKNDFVPVLHQKHCAKAMISKWPTHG
jgi:hypothetical protein